MQSSRTPGWFATPSVVRDILPFFPCGRHQPGVRLDCIVGTQNEGRYHDAKLLLTAEPGTEGHVDGYLEESLENLKESCETSCHFSRAAVTSLVYGLIA
jgi:hypothetical protein